MINRVVVRLLRSRLSGLVEDVLMLLTVTGRHTGRSYAFPVQYVQDGRVLWVYVGPDTAKTWWRNLLGGADVELLLRGRACAGTAVALVSAEHPQAVEHGLRRYVDRFPSVAKRLGVPAGDATALTVAAARTVIVRIELSDDRGV
jgi:hypothetical protein